MARRSAGRSCRATAGGGRHRGAKTARADEKPVKRSTEGRQAPEKTPLFSGVTSYGGLVFISGVGATSRATSPPHQARPRRDPEEAREVGSSMEKVLKVNVYLNDLKDYKAMNDAFLGRFGPSRRCARRSRPQRDPATRSSRSTASPRCRRPYSLAKRSTVEAARGGGPDAEGEADPIDTASPATTPTAGSWTAARQQPQEQAAHQHREQDATSPGQGEAIASNRNCRRCRGGAPRRLAHPISWVRSVTLTSMMFMTPIRHEQLTLEMAIATSRSRGDAVELLDDAVGRGEVELEGSLARTPRRRRRMSSTWSSAVGSSPSARGSAAASSRSRSAPRCGRCGTARRRRCRPRSRP